MFRTGRKLAFENLPLGQQLAVFRDKNVRPQFMHADRFLNDAHVIVPSTFRLVDPQS